SVDSVDSAAGELELVVEIERARGFAGADGEGGECSMFFVELEHAMKVNVADDVDVVEKEGLVEARGIFEGKRGRFLEAGAGLEEEIVFTGDLDAQVKVVARAEKFDDLTGKVVDVDDELSDSERAEPSDGDFQ